MKPLTQLKKEIKKELKNINVTNNQDLVKIAEYKLVSNIIKDIQKDINTKIYELYNISYELYMIEQEDDYDDIMYSKKCIMYNTIKESIYNLFIVLYDNNKISNNPKLYAFDLYLNKKFNEIAKNN